MDVLDLGLDEISKVNMYNIEDILKVSSLYELSKMRERLMKAKDIFAEALEGYNVSDKTEAKAIVFYYLIEVEQKGKFLSSFRKDKIYSPLFFVEIKDSFDSALSIFPEEKYTEINVYKGRIAKDVLDETLEKIKKEVYADNLLHADNLLIEITDKLTVIEHEKFGHPRELKQPINYPIEYIINKFLKT